MPLPSIPIDGNEKEVEPEEFDEDSVESEHEIEWVRDIVPVHLNIRMLAKWLKKGESVDKKRKIERERNSVRVAGGDISMTLNLVKGGFGGSGLEWLFTAGVLKGLWVVEDKIGNMKELFKIYKEVLLSGDYAAQEMLLSTSKSGGSFVINVRLVPDEFERINNIAELYGYERPLVLGRLFSLGLLTEKDLKYLSERAKTMLGLEAVSMIDRLEVRKRVIEALHGKLIDNKIIEEEV